MGMPGWKELLIILLVVLVVFGAKKLKTIGSDLGGAIRGFKKSMNEGDKDEEERARQLQHSEPDADFDTEKNRTADKPGGNRPA